jgi:serine/threonine protein kinase
MQLLHSQTPPIVHRDLRSPNIFLVSTEENAKVNAKVGDFGMARYAAPKIKDTLKTWQVRHQIL